MKGLSNIRSKPSLPPLLNNIHFLNTIFDGTAQGINPYIFVPIHIFENLRSSKPNPYNVSLIIHEQTHLDRQKKYGLFKWMLRYIFDSNFRFEEEMKADRMQMKFMKKNKLIFPFQKKAKMLSGWFYLKPVSYERAYFRLKVAWKNA